MSAPKPNLMIAIPTYGGVQPGHAASVLRLQASLLSRGIPCRCIQHNMAEISRSRAVLAALFMRDADATHLLFIDSDIEFEPAAIDALLRIDQPFAACAYPKRHIDLDRLIAAARRLTDRDQIVASAFDFVVHPDGESAQVEDGYVRVAGIGLGLALIRRDVFDRLAATGSVPQWPGPGSAPGPISGFFDPFYEPNGLLSEDLAFCRRWRQAGGEIWACIDQDIGHIGTWSFRARLIDALTAPPP